MSPSEQEVRLRMLEDQVASMLEERRWFLRAFAVICLTTVAGIAIEVLRLI